MKCSDRDFERRPNRKLFVVGIGMGGQTLTGEAVSAIQSADAVFGAPRMVEEASRYIPCDAQRFEIYEKKKILDKIDECGFERSVLMVSGDVGFYSAAEAFMSDAGVSESFDAEFVAGISSVSYFAAKCGFSWQDAALISCHGRRGNIVDAVRRSRLTFALTGGNVSELAGSLVAAGFGDLKIYLGERLGMEGERITFATAWDMIGASADSLSVIIAENPEFDERVRFGISDDEFVRGDVPMTKSNVRSVIMSKLAIRPSDRCIDIGCGTGSVTVEMALAAYRGSVLGVDISAEAVELTRENLKNFHIGNAEVVNADARGWLESEEFDGLLQNNGNFDAAFIGGTKGGMRRIVERLLALNRRMRIVITAITLESALEAICALEDCEFSPQVAQVQVSESKKAGDSHMMLAQNPIYIISV